MDQGVSGPGLRRSVTLPLLTLYGVGTMVGGGFYALMGEVAADAGTALPLAFAIAAVVALFSALSFGELSARYPFSAGEAHYVREAFGLPKLAVLVGALVILTGVVSAATLCRAIGGFVFELVGLPVSASIVATALALGLVAAWGIGQSVALATAITVIEVGGLIAILALRGEALGELPERWRELVTFGDAGAGGVLVGSFLAFYAFVGFEDMVNLAEEVKEPARNLPLAILISLAVTTLLYVAVASVAVLAVPIESLAGSRTPLATIVASHGEGTRRTLGAISVLAGANGALVQIVMAARIVHGLARRSHRTRALAAVNHRTQTPVRATAGVVLLVVVLALAFPLVGLASVTSAILLAVFAVVNLSLVVLQARDPAPAGSVRVARWVPVAGLLASSAFLLVRLLH